MRGSKIMDFEYLGRLYEEDAPLQMKYYCAWCNKALLNQTEKKYREKGNCCPECSARFTRKLLEINTEREVTMRNRKIESLREEMDYLGLELDYEVSEKERSDIVKKMEEIFEEIKRIKKI